MEKKLTFLDNLYNFSLVKFQLDEVVLVHKYTREAYTFHVIQSGEMFPGIAHPSLSRPILYKNGAIYHKGDSTLFIELENRRRFSVKQYYTLQELSNTFSPLIECVEYLHQEGIAHGSIACQSVLFFENGEILLKDWLVPIIQNKFYLPSQKPTFDDDMKALGLMIAQAACLESFDHSCLKKIDCIIQKVKQRYQSQFCYGLIILLLGMSEKFQHVLSLFSNEEKSFSDEAVLNIYNSCQSTKPKQKIDERKTETTIKLFQVKEYKEKCIIKLKKQPITESKVANYSQVSSHQGSPTKKFNITTTSKKLPKHDDNQNKKVFNDEVKKRQIEKITKIIERSNAFVNQLMARKNIERKTKNNSSLYQSHTNCENAATVKKAYLKEGKLTSPSKRLRTISKKK